MRSRTCPLLTLLAIGLLMPACDGPDRISAGPVIESISISPDPLTLERGSTSVLRVRAFTATGEEVSSPAVKWTVVDLNVAIVNAQSVLIALRGGVTEVRATVGARTASAKVTVTDGFSATVAFLELLPGRDFVWIGDTLSFTTRARNKFYEPVPSTVVQWSSSSPSVASVTADGAVRGLSAGTSTISVAVGDVTAFIAVAVEAVSSLEITGARLTIPGSESWMTLGAVRRGILRRTRATWTSADSTVASIASDGRVKAIRAGSTTIAALREGIAYSAPLTVRPLAGRITFLEEGVLHALSLDDGLVETVPLIRGAPLQTLSAAASPDGRDVAYECQDAICVVPLAGGEPRQVIFSASSPSWSADGRTISARLNFADIAVLDLASGRLRSVRPGHYLERPRISPNGTEVAFECDHENAYEPPADICITTTATSFGSSAVVSIASRVAWSSDGGRLSYFQSGLCTALTREPARCIRVFEPAVDGAPIGSAWSPKRTHLVVARADGLWIVEPDGANPVRIRPYSPRLGSQLGSPSWTLAP